MARRCSLGAVVLVVTLVLSGCDWSQYMFGPAHTGFNAGESTITPTNAGTLAPRFTVSLGGAMSEAQTSVVGNTAYTVADDGHLYAFSSGGSRGCEGTPPVCTPEWQATVGVAGASMPVGPSVVGGIAYVYGTDGNLYAFDAAGYSNCAGAPKVCSPLWQAHVDGNQTQSPTVVHGVVYVTTNDNGGALEAFDATGNTNCAGSPKVCTPMWTSTAIGAAFGAVTVANNIAYVAAQVTVYAFDATGSSCTGVPKVCAPLWQDALSDAVSGGAAVSGGILYVDTSRPLTIPPMPHGGLEAFDANGVTNCSGSPKLCQPLWTSGNYPSWAPPTIANGLAYVPTLTNGLVAFDAAGKQNCFGTPRACEPVWTTPITTTFETAPATVAGHVLFVVGGSTQLYAFDADGTMGCAGLPKVCNPIWSTQTYIANEVTVANGVVYLNGAMSLSSSASAAVFAYGLH